MPTLAETLVGSALTQAQQQTANPGSGIAIGADLAKHIEDIKMQKMQLQQQQQQQYVSKVEKFSSLYDTAAKLPPGGARNQLFKTVIPKTRDALGLQKEFPDDTLSMFNSNPEVVGYLKSKVEAGEMTLPDLLSNAQDAEWVAKQIPAALQAQAGKDLTPTVTDSLDELQKSEHFRVEEKNKNINAQLVQTGQNQRQATQISSTGNVELSKKVGDIYSAFQAEGGEAALQKNIKNYQDAIDLLKNGTVKFGTLGKMAYGSSETAMAALDPKAKALLDNVRGGVNMRAALADPNPTERQVNMILGRTLDPRLPNAENIKKLENSIKEMQQTYNSKKQEFQKFGFDTGGGNAATPSGTPPPAATPTPPPDGFKQQKMNEFKALPPDAQKKALPAFAQFLNMTPQDLQKQLGIAP